MVCCGLTFKGNAVGSPSLCRAITEMATNSNTIHNLKDYSYMSSIAVGAGLHVSVDFTGTPNDKIFGVSGSIGAGGGAIMGGSRTWIAPPVNVPQLHRNIRGKK